MRVTDPCGIGNEDDVAQQCDRCAQTHGVTVHGGNDREVDVEEVPDHRLCVVLQGSACRRILQFREPREVAAGGERPTLRREEHGRGLTLVSQRAEERRQVGVQIVVDGVDRRTRVVDGHDQDGAVPFEADGAELVLVGHAFSVGRGSRGNPSSCSAITLERTSVVPPPIVKARLKR